MVIDNLILDFSGKKPRLNGKVLTKADIVELLEIPIPSSWEYRELVDVLQNVVSEEGRGIKVKPIVKK